MEKFARMPYMEAIAESYIRDQALDIERCAKELANPTALVASLRNSSSFFLPVCPLSQSPDRQSASRDDGSPDPLKVNPFETATQSPFDQYMKRGYSQNPRAEALSSKDIHWRLEAALSDFTQALKALRAQGNGNTKEFHHVYKKLMDTEEGFSHSHLITPEARLEHLEEAQQWGARARDMARQTGKQSMLAQTELLLVCLEAREIELGARQGPPSGSLLSRRDMVLQKLLEKMQSIRSNPPGDAKRLQEFERQTNLWRGRIKNGLRFNCN